MSTDLKLTPKQERFAQVYVETGNASEAYRQAYNVREGTKESTINRKAKECYDNGKISARIEQLQSKHAKRHNITLDSLLADLEEDRQLARSLSQTSAAVTATMGKAKLLGLDKLVLDHTSNDGTMTPTVINVIGIE